MNYSELIHDFLDGTMEQAEEEELLMAIARRADLREELRQALALKAAFKADFQALTPPMHLTNSIFAEMGFASPGASALGTSALATMGTSASASVATGGMFSAIYTFLQGSFLTAVASSFLTAALFLTWNHFASEESGRQERIVQLPATLALQRITPPVSYLQETKHLQTVTRKQWTSSSAHNFEQNNIRNFNSKKQEQSSAQQWQDESGFGISSSSNIIVSTPSDATTSTSSDDVLPPTTLTSVVREPSLPTVPYKQYQTISAQEPLSLTDATPGAEGFFQHLQINARGITSVSLPRTTLPSNPSSFLRNTAIGALYRFTEQHCFGFEVGEETFFQRFRATDGERQLVLDVQQNPSLLWAGLAYRYVMMPENNFSPILHTVLGGTQLGATGRLMLGLNYSPDARTQFTLGVESSALVYTHQGVWYASPKIGITYGVSLKF